MYCVIHKYDIAPAINNPVEPVVVVAEMGRFSRWR